jgi:Lrp/AsnC family transcriptional regulator, leucine-responsive regulatory protein
MFREGDPLVKLDEIDLRILQVLQANARIPILDLAERAGLSRTPCSRRLRRLEEEAIIKKYIAVLNPKFMNLEATAFVGVRTRHSPKLAAKFRAAILQLPNVRGCYAVTGGYDYLLSANAKDMQSLWRWVMEDLHHIPSVLHTHTSIVMESVKDEPSFFLRDLETQKGFSMLREQDPSVKLDEIDFHMLQVLQDNARISVLDLAERVGLSRPPCSRRLRRMEEKAIIKNYIAVLNPQVMNPDVTAFMSVRVRHPPEMAAKFRAAILRMPNIRGCYAVTGDYDYLLRANAKDMHHFSQWVVDDLDNIPSIVDTYTSIVVDSIKDEPSFFLRDLTALKVKARGNK